MTNAEIIWLSKRLPKAAVEAVSRQANEASDFWAGLAIPKSCTIAAQLVIVELAMIQFGGLRLLNRSPA